MKLFRFAVEVTVEHGEPPEPDPEPPFVDVKYAAHLGSPSDLGFRSDSPNPGAE